MNFSESDIKIIVCMSLAVILMSLIIPNLGFTGNEAQSSDIPEYNTTKNKFDFAGEFPDRPGNPSQGRLVYDNSTSIEGDNRRIWLHGDTSGGQELILLLNGTKDNPAADIHSNNWTSGNADKERFELTQLGDATTITHNGYKIEFEYTRILNKGDNDVTMKVRYRLVQQPADTSWYKRTPILGDVLDTADKLPGMVGWGVSVIWWYFTYLVTTVSNLFVSWFGAITYFVDTLHWLMSTYFGVVDAAPGWASLFVMVPGILLFLEFSKLVMIAIDLIWIG